jgi:septation ring formation regulator EzrA
MTDLREQIIEILHDNNRKQAEDIRDLREEQEKLRTEFTSHDKRAEGRHYEICSRLDKYNSELEVHIQGVATAQKRIDQFQDTISDFLKSKAADDTIKAHNVYILKVIGGIIATLASLAGIWQLFF